MNKPIQILLIILCILVVLQFKAQTSYQDKNGATHLLDEISLADLQVNPYDEWYASGIKEFNPDLKTDIKNHLKDVKVKVFMATWCGDTKRHLPAFVKTWQAAGLSEDQLEIIAVHLDDDKYKQSPSRIEADYNVHRVPTFVFEKNGQEIGRIVERPVNDMATDITQIALGIPSKSRYQGVAMLHDYFLSQHSDSIYTNLTPHLRSINRNISGPGELNTYGYMLMSAERFAEAELAFRANIRLFRYNPNLRDSLGELYMKLEKYPEAKECFLEVLNIKKEDERASEMLLEIEEKLEE